jgi:hypothetical protein
MIYAVNDEGVVWEIDPVKHDGRPLSPPGFARDIAIGAYETVWVITNEKREGGYAPAWLQDPADGPTNAKWVTLAAPAAAVAIACR